MNLQVTAVTYSCCSVGIHTCIYPFKLNYGHTLTHTTDKSHIQQFLIAYPKRYSLYSLVSSQSLSLTPRVPSVIAIVLLSPTGWHLTKTAHRSSVREPLVTTNEAKISQKQTGNELSYSLTKFVESRGTFDLRNLEDT